MWRQRHHRLDGPRRAYPAPVGDDRLADYWGARWSASVLRVWQEYDDDVETNLNRSLAIGVSAVVGAEFRIVGDIHLLAEYSASLRWMRGPGLRDRAPPWHDGRDEGPPGTRRSGFGNWQTQVYDHGNTTSIAAALRSTGPWP
ncbi:MAG: hypothetical protein IPI48_12790 [bacterium]|nr:hypothetical protein [bacterium]